MPFAPTDLTGLEVWLDAQQVNGAGNALPADGAAVTTWVDLSGHSRSPTQPTSGQRPVWRAATFNNRPCVVFDGVDDNLFYAGTTSTFAFAQKTVYLVVQVTPSAANGNLLNVGTEWGALSLATTGRMRTGNQDVASASKVLSALAGSELTSPSVATWSWTVPALGDNTKTITRRCYRNGTSYLNDATVTTGERSTTNSANLTLGTFAGGTTAPTAMSLAAALVYSTLHDDATRIQVEGYLSGLYLSGRRGTFLPFFT